MDDARVRQREMDQPRPAEIIRQLVDDALGPGREPTDALDIARADFAQQGSGDARVAVRGLQSGEAGAADFADRGGKIGNLARARHARTARENLLDQGAARTRHADDENGKAGGIAQPLMRAYQLGRKRPAHAREVGERGGFVIGGRPALERIAFDQMPGTIARGR